MIVSHDCKNGEKVRFSICCGKLVTTEMTELTKANCSRPIQQSLGLHTTPVVESTWMQDSRCTECGWRGTNWSTCEWHRWRRVKSSNDAVRLGDQQYQMWQTGRAVLASTGRRGQRQSKCLKDFEDHRLSWVLRPISRLKARQQLVDTHVVEKLSCHQTL